MLQVSTTSLVHGLCVQCEHKSGMCNKSSVWSLNLCLSGLFSVMEIYVAYPLQWAWHASQIWAKIITAITISRCVCVCVQVKTEKSKMAKIKWKSTCACGNPFYFLKFWLPHPLIFSSSNYQKMLGWTLFKLNISYGEKEKEKKSYLLLAYPACLPFVTFSTGSLFVYLAQQKMDWQKQFQSVVYLFIMILIMNENLYSGTMHSCPVTLHNDVQIIKSINHTLLFIIINRINKKRKKKSLNKLHLK